MFLDDSKTKRKTITHSHWWIFTQRWVSLWCTTDLCVLRLFVHHSDPTGYVPVLVSQVSSEVSDTDTWLMWTSFRVSNVIFNCNSRELRALGCASPFSFRRALPTWDPSVPDLQSASDKLTFNKIRTVWFQFGRVSQSREITAHSVFQSRIAQVCTHAYDKTYGRVRDPHACLINCQVLWLAELN